MWVNTSKATNSEASTKESISKMALSLSDEEDVVPVCELAHGVVYLALPTIR